MVGAQHHALATLTPPPIKETRYPLYRRLGWPQGRSGRVRKISPLRDSIPRPYSPQRVVIPTVLSRPAVSCVLFQFSVSFLILFRLQFYSNFFFVYILFFFSSACLAQSQIEILIFRLRKFDSPQNEWNMRLLILRHDHYCCYATKSMVRGNFWKFGTFTIGHKFSSDGVRRLGTYSCKPHPHEEPFFFISKHSVLLTLDVTHKL